MLTVIISGSFEFYHLIQKQLLSISWKFIGNKHIELEGKTNNLWINSLSWTDLLPICYNSWLMDSRHQGAPIYCVGPLWHIYCPSLLTDSIRKPWSMVFFPVWHIYCPLYIKDTIKETCYFVLAHSDISTSLHNSTIALRSHDLWCWPTLKELLSIITANRSM